MPRNLSRIILEITDVRVERLQDITEDDATAELRGVYEPATFGKGFYPPGCALSRTARSCFECFWDTINSKRGYPWESNPWVWVIGFKIAGNLP